MRRAVAIFAALAAVAFVTLAAQAGNTGEQISGPGTGSLSCHGPSAFGGICD